MGMDYSAVNANLVRAELWSDQLKEILQDRLQGTKYVRWLSGFPDGNQFRKNDFSPQTQITGF
jgi:hypothetical protein